MQFICQNGGHLEKNGRELGFMVASVFFPNSNPQGVFLPSLVLVSYFER